jgi:Ca2+-binding RTX toxin-like protein
MKGGGGDDTLWGGTGVDTMLGGSGNDDYYVDDVYDKAIESANGGDDTVYSSVSYWLGANVENLVLTGDGSSSEYQSATGNGLDNKLTGNAGKNVLNGGAGADTMKGGKGNDVYYVDQAGDKVIELANEGYDTVFSEISYTLGANLETLGLIGDNDIDGFGNELKNDLFGNSGANTLYGYGGDDQIDGKLGADTMVGGKGDDWYTVDDAGDEVVELAGEGLDSVIVNADIDYTLTANVEKLYLKGHSNGTGNALDNLIYGSEYDNILDGGAGQDLMQGFGGDDTYYVDNVQDSVGEFDGDGYDMVFSTVDFDLSMRGQHAEVLSLAVGNAVYGTGNDENNTIFGNAGDNVLEGRGGSDVLSGLGGNDTFVFHAHHTHGDVVYEFDGNGAGAGDVLRFEGYGPGATLMQMSATEWMVSSADGSVQEVFTLVGGPPLHASDYVFV